MKRCNREKKRLNKDSAVLETHYSGSDLQAPSLHPSITSLDQTALRAKKFDKAGFHHKPSPFCMRWINGCNLKVPMINLNSNGSTILFYAAVNCGVLYNWTTNTMKLLQGHKNFVTCIASDDDARWLVTGDTGPENIVIIWDATTNYPANTIFEPHGSLQLTNLALSPDAKYLLTLAYSEQAEIRWWIWSFGLDVPHAKLELDAPVNSILALGFNPVETKQFLLMNKQDVWVGVALKVFVNERGVIKETEDYELKVRRLPRKVHHDYGDLTCYTFVKNTKQILVATSSGAILIFGCTMEYNENVHCTEHENLRFIKVLKLERHKINVIVNIDGVIVTGNEKGKIRFYDEHLMLLYWLHGFQPDCVKGLSFNNAPRSYMIVDPDSVDDDWHCLCWESVVVKKDSETGLMKQVLIKKRLPEDATTTNKPFVVRDFILCTQNQGIGFVDLVTEKMNIILDCKHSHATALTVHPEKPILCVGYEDGCITLRNFEQHRLVARQELCEFYTVRVPPSPDSIKTETEITVPELSVTCLKYSPSGLHLACGLNTGKLVFLDPVTAEVLSPEPELASTHPIVQINYSFDSMAVVIADSENTVLVYKYNYQTFLWDYVGKHRAHYKDIASVFFIPKKNIDGEYKLISLGQDRTMVEYDIRASTEGCLEIYSVDRFEQTAVPLGGIVWPNPADLDAQEFCTDLPLLLVANDQYKYKIVNYETTMTLSTVLGPRYSTPVHRLQLVNYVKNEEHLQYLIFSTKNIIGLQKLPLDGNPWKHCGIMAHPIEVKYFNLTISEMCFREDVGYLFTIGSMDPCFIQWAVKYNSPELIAKKGGSELDPYYCLIEDGRPGWLFQEIRDLFYYIQIQCQGIFSPAMRRVKDFIPVESLPDLMRAIGFYPSEYEVENMLVDAKYKVYQRNPSAEVNFEEFVKLYLNYRPAFGETYEKLENAFQYFADIDKNNGLISKDTFLSTLRDYGECFSEELSWYLLSILSGNTYDSPDTPMKDFSFLSYEINFKEFLTYFLGLQGVESLEEPGGGSRKNTLINNKNGNASKIMET